MSFEGRVGKAGWQEKTQEEFQAWLQKYPRVLEPDMCGIVEPPMLFYYDWSLDQRQPPDLTRCAVARIIAPYNGPGKKHRKPKSYWIKE